jgi:D-amino-acid oxidase
MLYQIGFFILFCTSLFSEEHIYLKTPNLSQNMIIGTNVGIRPYRKSGVRIEAETIQDKLIIHNYGYGGSGITLCFGGAKEVMNILNDQKPASKVVAVLGAGVIGLATAYDLLDQGFEVHIYSDNWSPNLTSNVAAGIWTPLPISEDALEEKKQQNQRLLEASEQRFLACTGNQPQFAGVHFINSYSFKSNSSAEAIKTKHRGEEVIVHFDNGTVKNGRKIYEIAIDGKLFIADLFNKVKAKGVKLNQRHFESLEDILSLDESIIVNCTSLGSQKLFNDQELVPVRGQLIYFQPQEGIDYLLYQNVPNSTTTWVSIYPWSDRIIVGGVYESGQDEAVVNPETLNKIIENAQKCLSGEL